MDKFERGATDMSRKVRLPPTREELEKYEKMSHEEKQLRSKISIAKAHFNSVECIAKAHFNSVECIARHRMELGIFTSKEYRKIVGDAEERMEKTVDGLQQELDKYN